MLDICLLVQVCRHYQIYLCIRCVLILLNLSCKFSLTDMQFVIFRGKVMCAAGDILP